MYGKLIVLFCALTATASLVFGAPFESKTLTTTTLKPVAGSFEQVHVCVPSDSCGSEQRVIGIKIEYTCSCDPGYADQYCADSISKTSKNAQQIRSFLELNPAPIKFGQLFYCELQQTLCVHGVTVIQSKTAVCTA